MSKAAAPCSSSPHNDRNAQLSKHDNHVTSSHSSSHPIGKTITIELCDNVSHNSDSIIKIKRVKNFLGVNLKNHVFYGYLESRTSCDKKKSSSHILHLTIRNLRTEKVAKLQLDFLCGVHDFGKEDDLSIGVVTLSVDGGAESLLSLTSGKQFTCSLGENETKLFVWF